MRGGPKALPLSFRFWTLPTIYIWVTWGDLGTIVLKWALLASYETLFADHSARYRRLAGQKIGLRPAGKKLLNSEFALYRQNQKRAARCAVCGARCAGSRQSTQLPAKRTRLVMSMLNNHNGGDTTHA